MISDCVDVFVKNNVLLETFSEEYLMKPYLSNDELTTDFLMPLDDQVEILILIEINQLIK